MRKPICALAVGVTCLAALACASSSSPNLETYRGQAMAMGTTLTGANTLVQISIQRWSTDEERQALLDALEAGGSDGLRKALFESDETGFVTLGGRATYRLRYARESTRNGQKQIVLVTDRPISLVEARSAGARTRDYDISIIQLRLDENDSGEGSVAVGTEIELDSRTRTITLKHYSREPVRLMNISRVD